MRRTQSNDRRQGRIARARGWASFGLCLSLVACGGGPEKESPETSTDPAAAEDLAEPQALRWVTPEGWREEPPANPQRSKQYAIDVEGQDEPLIVAVSHWKNGVGGLSANLDRWRSSLGLSEDDVPPDVDTQTVNGMTVTLFDGVGSYTSMQGTQTDNARLLTAYIESLTRFDGVYTFRLVGPADQIAPHVERFRQLALGL